jgi:hypothetical protein
MNDSEIINYQSEANELGDIHTLPLDDITEQVIWLGKLARRPPEPPTTKALRILLATTTPDSYKPKRRKPNFRGAWPRGDMRKDARRFGG